jgi:hypothetical protein
LEHGYTPCDNNNNHRSNGDTKICPIHHCEYYDFVKRL